MDATEKAAELLAEALARRTQQFGENYDRRHGPLDVAVIADACVMVLENVFVASPATMDKVLEAIKLQRFKMAMTRGETGNC